MDFRWLLILSYNGIRVRNVALEYHHITVYGMLYDEITACFEARQPIIWWSSLHRPWSCDDLLTWAQAWFGRNGQTHIRTKETQWGRIGMLVTFHYTDTKKWLQCVKLMSVQGHHAETIAAPRRSFLLERRVWCHRSRREVIQCSLSCGSQRSRVQGKIDVWFYLTPNESVGQ